MLPFDCHDPGIFESVWLGRWSGRDERRGRGQVSARRLSAREAERAPTSGQLCAQAKTGSTTLSSWIGKSQNIWKWFPRSPVQTFVTNNILLGFTREPAALCFLTHTSLLVTFCPFCLCGVFCHALSTFTCLWFGCV